MVNIAVIDQDSDSLEALFDSIITSNKENSAPTKIIATDEDEVDTKTDPVINRIGKLTRQLHDCLRELGYDQKLQRVTSAVPITHDNLNYIAAFYKQTAETVLNATDAAQPALDKIESDSQQLEQEWQNLLENKVEVHQFKNFVKETQAILMNVSEQAKVTQSHLTDIMMAQAFHDITGQVIQRIIGVTLQMETELMDILLQNPPSMESPHDKQILLYEYVNKKTEQPDNKAEQDRMNHLLESLGF